ncbi:MAG: squalene synthase HpnC [Ignavibacteriae bacterium]|nr:squalene synthase HpnC [Ignavibacteriota bacterium]
MEQTTGNIISVEESFRYCEGIAKGHYENFPVGSILVPAEKRKYVWSIYAFARFADDIADSGDLDVDAKLEQLDDLEVSLRASLGDVESYGKQYSFLPALAVTASDLKIPVNEFTDLLAAFKQDSVRQRYDSFEELIDYSALSANPIGHLILYVFGYDPDRDEKLFSYSDSICTALQLTNFWQDVSPDLEIGRVYIPQNIMRKYDYAYEDLFKKVEDERFISVVKELVEKTRRIFLHGKPLVDELSGRLRYEIKATYLGGNEILNKIELLNYTVLSRRVKLGKSDKISLILKTFMSRV